LVVAGFALLWVLRGLFSIVAVAALVAFLLGPLIRWLHTRLHVPRWLALLVAYLIALLFTVAVGTLITGSVLASMSELDLAENLEAIRAWLVRVVGESRTITVIGIRLDLSETMSPLEGWLRGQGGLPVDGDDIPDALSVTPEAIGFIFGSALGSVRSVVGLIVAVFTSILVTTLIAMYLSADSRRYYDGLLRLVPPGYEGDALRLFAAVKRVWTGYMYGQLVNSLITGVMVWLVLLAVGLPGAFLMGFIMLILNMIPTIGPILAAVPGVLLALVQGSTRLDMSHVGFGLLVAGIYVVVVQLQASVIAPRVMGSAVKLPPAVVMLGLIAGLQLGGLLGSLLAVPVIATIRDVVHYLYFRLVGRDPWSTAIAAVPASPVVNR
jgi:predicted PurR-regulated permease PerM